MRVSRLPLTRGVLLPAIAIPGCGVADGPPVFPPGTPAQITSFGSKRVVTTVPDDQKHLVGHRRSLPIESGTPVVITASGATGPRSSEEQTSSQPVRILIKEGTYAGTEVLVSPTCLTCPASKEDELFGRLLVGGVALIVVLAWAFSCIEALWERLLLLKDWVASRRRFGIPRHTRNRRPRPLAAGVVGSDHSEWVAWLSHRNRRRNGID